MNPTLVIQKENPEKFDALRRDYCGYCLLELAKSGDGNSILYCVCNHDYGKMLWDKDEKEIIGLMTRRLL